MRQRIRKKQSKHSNTRIKSKRTRRRTVKKRQVNVKMGGGDAEVTLPYNAIVFDVDQTILPKLCSILDAYFDKSGNFIISDKNGVKRYIQNEEKSDDIKGKIGNNENPILKISEIKNLTKILSYLQEKGVKLFIATRCEANRHIDHPFLKKEHADNLDIQKLRDLIGNLRNLFTYTDASGNEKLRFLGAEKPKKITKKSTEEEKLLAQKKIRQKY